MIQRWLIVLIVSVGVFLTTSGLTITIVALPYITDSFQMDIRSAQWVILGYLLTTSSTLINFGRLGDLLGQLKMHTVGFIVFTLGSLVCGIVGSVEWLIVFRVFQALGASMIISNAPGIVTSSFPPEQRGRAIGLQAVVVGTSLSLGPILGGFLIALFGWRSVFLFNVPVGILGLIASYIIKISPRDTKKVKIDLPGSILFFISIAALVFASHRAKEIGWASPIIVSLLLISLLLLAAFVMIERRTANPMLDLSVFDNRVFTIAQLGNLLSHMIMFSVLFLMPFYLVEVLRVSPEAVGLLLLPLAVSMVFGGMVGGMLTDRFGTLWPSMASMLLFCLGLFAMVSLDADSSTLGIVTRLTLLGTARALYRSPNLTAILSSIAKDRLGVSGGIYATMRHMGNILGVALLGSFFNYRLAFYMAEGPPGGPALDHSALSFLSAFQETFYFSLFIAILALLMTAFQREPKGLRPTA
ncbi:MAG: DHA2 family efflux MFS transporter permease subunit [Deltaproteobacteria bacterium]|nr:DHA2 family efflux MFS transporter permease subunit [Deltaproteobacteria bacterium]